MEYFKYSLIGVFTVIIAYLSLCLFTPDRVVLSQSIVVNAPVDSTFKNVINLNTWNLWHPWFRKLQEDQYEVTSNSDSTQMISWSAMEQKGGRIDVIGFTLNSSIQTSLTYEKDNFEKVNQGEFLFEKQGNATKVSWILVGTEYPFLLKPATILLKEVFTGNYETGLKNLKALSEGRPIPKMSRIEQ